MGFHSPYSGYSWCPCNEPTISKRAQRACTSADPKLACPAPATAACCHLHTRTYLHPKPYLQARRGQQRILAVLCSTLLLGHIRHHGGVPAAFGTRQDSWLIDSSTWQTLGMLVLVCCCFDGCCGCCGCCFSAIKKPPHLYLPAPSVPTAALTVLPEQTSHFALTPCLRQKACRCSGPTCW